LHQIDEIIHSPVVDGESEVLYFQFPLYRAVVGKMNIIGVDSVDGANISANVSCAGIPFRWMCSIRAFIYSRSHSCVAVEPYTNRGIVGVRGEHSRHISIFPKFFGCPLRHPR
jgi:hypothetical protein